jgi:hypothetical protein
VTGFSAAVPLKIFLWTRKPLHLGTFFISRVIKHASVPTVPVKNSAEAAQDKHGEQIAALMNTRPLCGVRE